MSTASRVGTGNIAGIAIAIIGGGPGGYSAALYCARAGLKTLVLEKLSAGGQMALTHQVDNYPGFPEGIDGFELGEKMQQQAEQFGAVTELADVTEVHLDGEIKEVITKDGPFYSKAVIIATGTFLDSTIVIGESIVSSGPDGMHASVGLADDLRSLGLQLRRFGRDVAFEVRNKLLGHADQMLCLVVRE